MTAQDPDENARRLSGEAAPDGDPAAWFERLYADAAQGQAIIPWDRRAPHPLLVEWIEQQPANSVGRTLVVGSGLGDDAAFLAALRYRVIAFDISKSAIESARRRFPSTPADFRVADLLNPPAEWRQHFDLVVETYTTQSLPVRLRATVALHVGRFVAPGGKLLVLAVAQDGDAPVDGPPWPLSRADIESFAVEGLEVVSLELVREPPGMHHWRAVFTRPAG
ncbi:MAG TPA: methyltransferase domain-containing protein [Propionibacteriaceae bacterium]|nr:methyltransferase domain-containing protein [Propionibacteriaceae bacterium]